MCVAVGARLTQSPKVSKDSARLETQTVLHCGLQYVQGGRCELSACLELFHSAVSCPRRDQDRSCGALFHGEFQRALGPCERLRGRHIRRLYQDKDAKIDPIQVKTAIPSLSDSELADLSARADHAQHDFAVGVLGTTTLLLIILVIVVIILVAVYH